MKVFVISTCYDLMDLRAELRAELAQLNVEACFSDLLDSDFVVSAAPSENSIETCLANVRDSDLVIVILSQRYGPLLKGRYGDVSATRLEYDEARKHNKPILFYVRDRLEADHALWKKNGRKEDFRTAWVSSEKDAKGLFSFIDAHADLHRESGAADANNWYSTFRNSVALREMVNKHLKPQATKATAERMIERGETPLIMISSFHLRADRNSNDGPTGEYDLKLLNVGPIPAFDVKLSISFQGIVHKERFFQIPAILPAVSASPESLKTAHLNIDGIEMKKLVEASKSLRTPIWFRCYFEYSVSVGLIFRNMVQGYVDVQNNVVHPRPPHEFAGMNYVGPLYLIRHG